MGFCCYREPLMADEEAVVKMAIVMIEEAAAVQRLEEGAGAYDAVVKKLPGCCRDSVNSDDVAVGIVNWKLINGWPFKVIKRTYCLPNVVVEYKCKHKEYSAEDISSMHFVHLKKLAESYLGTNVKDVVITVPPYFNDFQRQATMLAAHLAGLDVLQIIDEPVAAAIAYGLHMKKTDTNVLIFDLDDVTFDMSIVTIDENEVVAHGASIHAANLIREKGEKVKTLPTVPLLNIVPLSLGVDAHDGVFSVIIPRNTPIPAAKEQIYFTTVDNQTSIPFNAYQGERSRAKDNKWLGNFEVEVSPAPKGKSKVIVVFHVDADGTLNCKEIDFLRFRVVDEGVISEIDRLQSFCEGFTPAIGIDLGIRDSCVGICWHQDKVEIIKNERGYRTTSSIVAFTPIECLTADSAIDQAKTNPANTVDEVQRLIGRRFNDPEVQNLINRCYFKVIKGKYGLPKVVVEYKRKQKEYYAEEISSMHLVHLKKLAESHIGTTVKDAVITVPPYFNDSQRQATKVAAHLAGLDVLQIIDKPVAAAIAYGLHMKTSDVNVLVFDLDYVTFEVSLITTDEKGKLTVKATGGDTFFGGFDLVEIVVDHFVKEFNRIHQMEMDITGNLKARYRLRDGILIAIEDLISDSETTISIDCLYNGIDFSTSITRDKFEYMSKSFFSKCIETLASFLRDAKINKTGVDDIVLVGGWTKLPKLQHLLQEFFNVNELFKSINSTEGERSRAKDNKWLGEFEVAVSPAPKGKSKITVAFSVDANGTLNCKVKELTTGLKKEFIINHDKEKLSHDVIKKMVKDAEKYKMEDQEYIKIMHVRNVLKEYIYNVRRKMKKIGSTNKTRLHAEEIERMETAIEAANEYVDGNQELADVDEYKKVQNQLEKLCVSVIAQLV
ncbi:hypothetical protein E3N88_43365 [Mikania micrantha]|uniref:Uncharacterized protein n=1 Tax=Mikania micrantha TaxID=192012 RepID=A0A5N6LHE5_9ASTR|nr:hypothetical protein E3N88_43365 [Mikania micrantha]